MIELELTEGPPVEVPLDLRTERGRPKPDAPMQLASRVVVGSPQFRRLIAADAGSDQDLQQFIESEAATWDYYLIALSCTFVSDDEQRLADAWLRINLSNPDNATDAPIAHSMEPIALAEIRELSYSVKISVPLVISGEASLGGKKNKVETAVQALFEGTSTPAWTFSETSTRPLHGMQRLRMVVRSAAAQPILGTIEIGANVHHRRLGLNPLPYIAPIAELPTPPLLEITRPRG